MAESSSLEPTPLPTVAAFALAVPVVFASIAVSASIVMKLGATLLQAAFAAVLLGCSVLAPFLGGVRRRIRCQHVRVTRRSLGRFAVFGSVLVLLVVLWDRAAFRALSDPIIYGADPGHHGALVAWLDIEDAAPRADPRLGGLVGYPFGAHAIAATLCRVFGLSPLTALWLIALSAVAAMVPLFFWLIRQLSGDYSVAGFWSAVVVWITGWRVSIGMVTADFFFAQTLSLLFAVAGVGCVVACATEGVPMQRRARFLPVAVLLAIAAALSYPQQAGIVVLAAGASVVSLVMPFASALRRHQRVRLATGAVVAVVIAAVVLVPKPGYLSKKAITGVNDGAVLDGAVASFGGPFAQLMLLSGVVFCVIRMRRHCATRALIGALFWPLLIAVSLIVLRSSGVGVTRYRIIKNLYTAFPFAVVCVGVLVAAALQRVPHLQRPGLRAGSAAFAFVTAMALALRPPHLTAVSTPLLDRGSYELARVASATLDPRDVALIGDGIGPYVNWWMGLRRPITPDIYEEVPRSTRQTRWPDDLPEHYAIVDANLAPAIVARPDVEVMAQRRGAVLVRKREP